MSWRPMTPQDLGTVQILADTIHVDHPEDREVFEERQRLYPQGCHVLVAGERLIGYAVTHPWNWGEPPSLNSRLGEIPRTPTTYYVHDVALLPDARGQGHASRIAGLLADHARENGFSNISLVAVNKSQAFWEGLGFRATTVPGLEKKLLSYGSDAVLMVHDLTKLKD